MDIPGGLQGLRPGQSSSSSSHFPAGIPEVLNGPGEGFVHTFPRPKRSAKLGSRSGSELSAHFTSSTPAAHVDSLSGVELLADLLIVPQTTTRQENNKTKTHQNTKIKNTTTQQPTQQAVYPKRALFFFASLARWPPAGSPRGVLLSDVESDGSAPCCGMSGCPRRPCDQQR